MLILVLIPSIIWLLLKQIHSPWWLENVLSTPFIIVVIYSALMLAFIHYVSYLHCVGYFVINVVWALSLNNMASLPNKNTFDNLSPTQCTEPVVFFQFNLKYTEKQDELNELIAHLVMERYHLITLQGVSQQAKNQIVEQLNPYYPYFVRGENEHQQVNSDQLLFSQYAFTKIKYYNNNGSAYLISSQWQLPFNEINLHTLHPPSPRNERLWQTRNQTLYKLKHALKSATERSSIKDITLKDNSLVIGDLNLSKHSARIELLRAGMNTRFVNSWPKQRYALPFMGLAIDHFLVSKPSSICSRQRINEFRWSDHYAVKTKVNFKK
jgi:hypothetical protein